MEFLPKNEQQKVRALSSRQERLQQGRFLAEGKKLCLEALASDMSIEYVVLKEGADEESKLIADSFETTGIEVFQAGTNGFERMTDAVHPQDIFCVIDLPNESNDISFNRFLALDAINDPGNLGTIIRTADWFGINHIVIGGTSADPYNPKTLRASMGSVFRMNFNIEEHLSDFIKTYKNEHPDSSIFGFDVHAEQSLSEIKKLPSSWGLILGSESHGISPNTQKAITDNIRIPGIGKAESLNVGIATGIALYHMCTLADTQ